MLNIHFMSEIVAELQSTGAFLSLSRQQPELFKESLRFTLNNGTQVYIPAEGIIVFEPQKSTEKDIVYSCGVHGNETAPIEICDELVISLLTNKLQVVHRLLVIFGNLPAMGIAQRFIEENMNRLFDGEHSNPIAPQNNERKRAKLLEDAVKDFFTAPDLSGERQRFHYDLHTAIRDSKNEKFAVYPFTHGRSRKPEHVAFMGACGVNTILLSNSPTTTFSYFSTKHFEADAFTVELGKVKPFGENDMSRFEAARRTLFDFATSFDFSLPDYDSDKFLIYKINQIINKTQPDFRLNFEDDTPNFADFRRGCLLAEEKGTRYVAEQEGEAIVFPNANVEIGQRALLTVVPTEL